MKNNLIFLCLVLLVLSACIKDDFIDDLVEPEISISSSIETLGIGTNHQFESRYINNIGREENVSVEWHSLDPSIIEITEDGLATGLQIGSTNIIVNTIELENQLSDTLAVQVGETTVNTNNVISGTIVTTSSYLLEGTFELSETQDGLSLDVNEDYQASSALPGFYLYLSNNRNSIADAFEVSKITTFNGAHNYTIPGVELNEYNFLVYYCKPFNIKVGEAVLN